VEGPFNRTRDRRLWSLEVSGIRQMPRRGKITALMLRQIPALIDRGLTAQEIADMVGCTLGSLRVTCSKSKISLRRKNRGQSGEPKADRASTPYLVPCRAVDDHVTLILRLPNEMANLFRQQAAAKGLSAAILATQLLETIVRDRLWNAVLDEDEPSARRAA
jgi:hypothetical protein